MSNKIQNLIDRRNRALHAFATLGNLCAGSLVKTYRKCGKPNCHCAEEGGKGYGPSYLLNYSVNGKQKSKRIKAGQGCTTILWEPRYKLAVRRFHHGSNRLLMIAAFKTSIALAPRIVQCIPPRLSLFPTIDLQPPSTTPVETQRPIRRNFDAMFGDCGTICVDI